MSKAEEVFKDELAMIGDEAIKKFVLAAFEMVPIYFWTEPCSSTGKYHPRWNQGQGGIVRHTKVATFYASELTRAMVLTKEEVMRTGFGEKLYQDVVVAAMLLHDGWKHGPNYDGTFASMPANNCECHGVEWANHLYKTLVEPTVAKGEVPFKFKALLRGIAGHMGIWTGITRSQYWPNHQKDSVVQKVCNVVHLADYISSRKPTDTMYQIMEYGR